jgi:hypothetical protein
MKFKFAAVAAAALSVACGSVQAAEAWVGAYAHDVTFIGETLGFGAAGRESGAVINVGVGSDRIDSLRWLGRPASHAFAAINTAGDTSFAAVGLNWPLDIGEAGGFYIRPGLGLAVHDGETELPDFRDPGLTPAERQRRINLRSEKIEFGSRVLFEPELAVGYRLSERTSAELSYVHLSHGQILSQGKNQGLDQLGVRIRHRFGD